VLVRTHHNVFTNVAFCREQRIGQSHLSIHFGAQSLQLIVFSPLSYLPTLKTFSCLNISKANYKTAGWALFRWDFHPLELTQFLSRTHYSPITILGHLALRRRK
jgi:hypothetical protein